MYSIVGSSCTLSSASVGARMSMIISSGSVIAALLGIAQDRRTAGGRSVDDGSGRRVDRDSLVEEGKVLCEDGRGYASYLRWMSIIVDDDGGISSSST